jgi:hypothetical protein
MKSVHHEMMLALRAAEICLKSASDIHLKNRNQLLKEMRALEFIMRVIAKGEAHDYAMYLPEDAGEGEI